MNERLNFICLGGRALAPHEHRLCLEALASCVAGINASFVEVIRINGDTAAESVLPWDASARLLDLPINEGELLIGYFDIAGSNAAGRQSVTIDTRQGTSVLTLSLQPRLVSTKDAFISTVLSELAGWAMKTFEAAALACGPELDLYEVGDAHDLRSIEKRLASDWRCWLSMSTHRFPTRMTAEE